MRLGRAAGFGLRQIQEEAGWLDERRDSEATTGAWSWVTAVENKRAKSPRLEAFFLILTPLVDYTRGDEMHPWPRDVFQRYLREMIATAAEFRGFDNTRGQQMWFMPRVNHTELPAIRSYLGLLDPAFYTHSGFRLEPWEICFPMLNFTERLPSSVEVAEFCHFSIALERSLLALTHLIIHFLQSQPSSHLEIHLQIQSHHPDSHAPSAMLCRGLTHLPLKNTDPPLNAVHRQHHHTSFRSFPLDIFFIYWHTWHHRDDPTYFGGERICITIFFNFPYFKSRHKICQLDGLSHSLIVLIQAIDDPLSYSFLLFGLFQLGLLLEEFWFSRLRRASLAELRDLPIFGPHLSPHLSPYVGEGSIFIIKGILLNFHFLSSWGAITSTGSGASLVLVLVLLLGMWLPIAIIFTIIIFSFNMPYHIYDLHIYGVVQFFLSYSI
ncbi:hypothetical protein M5K25_008536 [Dendrobium thyrsiflorum]|uniref:Uncharacterized protein n=1 Tax=Dendrobium thyrsiflorum TaxID=117978 RepID=A0ABD0V8V9_DENTH